MTIPGISVIWATAREDLQLFAAEESSLACLFSVRWHSSC